MFEDVAPGGLLAAVAAHDVLEVPLHERAFHRIDRVVALDRVVRAAQAAQLAEIAALHAERSAEMGLGHGDPTLSVIGEVSLARGVSPSAAQTQVCLALDLARLPKVAALLAAGRISEPAARAVSREVDGLGVDDFPVLDARLEQVLPGLTPVKAGQATARAVIDIDAEAARVRAERARADARVTTWANADGTATLQVRGPAEQVTAAHDALDTWAEGLRSAGDERTKGQIMAQTLVERVTGAAHADAIDVEIQLVMDAKTLIADGDTPVELVGHGPIAPDVADDIIARARHATIRRLLVDPVDGTLVARDPRRRFYTGRDRAHIKTRDRRCRQPGCDCRIRDIDHITEHSRGGDTTTANGQGLCRRSHHIKEQPGYTVTAARDGTITWRTPSGHTYTSHPPPILHRE